MSATDNQSVANLIVLCLEHAAEVDDKGHVASYPIEDLKRWKQEQLEDFDRLGQPWVLPDDDVAAALQTVSIDMSTSIASSVIALGGTGGEAPGAGGGGGGAIGPGVIGGEGGAGGQVVVGIFKAEDLPDVVNIEVGRGGTGGQEGENGEDGGDTSFGGFVVAHGGRAGESGGACDDAFPAGNAQASRIAVSTLLLADFAQVREGLAFVVAGGWSYYDAPRTGGVLFGYATIVFEIEPGPTAGTCPVVVELIDSNGATRWDTRVEVELAASPDASRICLSPAFNCDAQPPGQWAVRVSTADGRRELALQQFLVIAAPTSEHTP